MDRYEYKLKTEQIQKLIARKEYKAALQIVETLDWRKEKDVRILSAAAEVYVANKQYSDAIDLLVQAYELAPIGRRVIYRLTEVAILAGETEAAESYLEEFREVAPGDSGSYILEYKLARLKKAPLEERIQILEKYQEQDFDEKWSYELAKLYEEAGRIDECVRLCDDIVLWFSLGKYVERALALKAKHAPLTASQQDRINNPEIYQERFNEVREEMNRENEAPSESEPESTDSEEKEPEKLPEKQPETDTTFREIDLDEEESESEEELKDATNLEETSETAEPEEETTEQESQDGDEEPKGLRRVVARLFGIHEEELFGDDDLDDEEEEESEESSEEEVVDAEPGEVAREPEAAIPETAVSEEDTFEESENEDLAVETEDDTSWISQMVEETLQGADELEEQEDEEAEQDEVREPVAVESEPETKTLGEVAEAEEEPKQEPEKPEPENEEPKEKKETLEELLQDPTIRNAAETGDVFAATIREAEEETPTEDEESDVLEGQLEFDFTRLSAIEKVKEEREKELGIWDDPFRYLVMQEPEEEAQVRRILSGEEESLQPEEEPTAQDAFATRELREVSEILSQIPDFTEESESVEAEQEPAAEEAVEAEEVTESESGEATEEIVEEATEAELNEAVEPAESVDEPVEADVTEQPEEPVEQSAEAESEGVLSIEEEETPVDAATEEADTAEETPEPEEETPEGQPEFAEHGIIEVTDVEVEDMPMPETESEPVAEVVEEPQPEVNEEPQAEAVAEKQPESTGSQMDDIWRLLDEEEQALRRTEEEVQKALEEEPAFVLPDAVQPDVVAREAAQKKKQSEIVLETPPAPAEVQPEPAEKIIEQEPSVPENVTSVESEIAEAETKIAEAESTEPIQPETPVVEEPTKAWSAHNIVVRSEDMKAGFELAIGYLMRLPMEERLPSVAKTSGSKLNGKDWDELADRLKDRILVIEEANAMSDDTMLQLRRYLAEPGHMAVMIDTEENIAEIGLRNKPLLDMFPTEYAYYEYSVEEIVDHGLTYAAQKGWKLDDMALLAYSAAVEAVGEEQPGRELIEAENIMDDAIERAESGLFSGLFRKKEKAKILHENHFKQR